MYKQTTIFSLIDPNLESGGKPQLRPYQIEALSQINQAWQQANRVLFQMPTGTGKTTLFCEVIDQYQGNVLVVVHRIELIHQIADRLTQFGLSCGIINAQVKGNPSERIQVASIQTLQNRTKPPAGLVIIDESHHATADSYRALFEQYPHAKFLGVTATPIRLSGQGFDDLFDTLIVSPQIKEFITMGYLCSARQFAGYCPDLSKVKVSQGDYNAKELGEILDSKKYITSVLQSYQNLASGKKTIAFCATIDQSKDMTTMFKSVGINACHLDATTPKDERDSILSRFRAGDIQIVCNVEIISEGFDVPDCEAVILAAPTKSLGRYLQTVGRVLRPAKGKESAIILDCANMYLELGLATSNRHWQLEATKDKKRNLEDYVTLDSQGRVARIRPVEIEGTELIELDADLVHLVHFEDFIEGIITARSNGRYIKGIATWYKYAEFRGLENISQKEFNYMRKRLNETFNDFNRGFWWHKAKELNLVLA